MRRHVLLSIVLLLCAAIASAATLPELFQKVKRQFRMGSYVEALATLETLATQSRKPGSESLRSALEPGLLFYRGACLAALGRPAEARPEFEAFLAFRPNAALDPAVYPKPVIRAFDEARKAVDTRSAKKPVIGSMTASYRAFQREVSPRDLDAGEDWGSGPVKYLMTAKERQRWEHLSDPVSRSEFIASFWKARDPRPETPENEFREEFEKRVAFADAKLAQDEVRGSLTDRGMVFVLLGPPTYAGERPILPGEDRSEAAGLSRYTRNDITAALKETSANRSTVLYDQMTGPETRLIEAGDNREEIWHYRRELLPKGVPYQQVDFQFITRKGYGKNVLQRDSAALATLEAALKERR